MPEQGKVRKTLAKARFDIAVQIVRCSWVLRREIAGSLQRFLQESWS